MRVFGREARQAARRRQEEIRRRWVEAWSGMWVIVGRQGGFLHELHELWFSQKKKAT